MVEYGVIPGRFGGRQARKRHEHIGKALGLVPHHAIALGDVGGDHPHAQPLGRERLALPLHAHVGEEVMGRRRRLRELLVAAVAALQALLALTGICVGCRMYFLRWMVPDLFARLLGRADEGLPVARQAFRRPGESA